MTSDIIKHSYLSITTDKLAFTILHRSMVNNRPLIDISKSSI